MQQKFIFVTGGVLSGLGKGIAAASIGHILSHKYNVVPIKMDGYLNTDPGTMNPQEHGEVFVLDDGTEVDMDFGHYERYFNCTCTKEQSITMGKVFSDIQKKERRGDYLGKTVQLIPHVTDLIKEKIKIAGENAEIVIVEVGGTVGDIESELFLEAIRQLSSELEEENSMFVHLTYVPIPPHVGEPKTKPTQQSVKLLLERGIRPDIILARCTDKISDQIKDKIALFCNVKKNHVISAHDVRNIYEIPEIYVEQNMIHLLNKKLGLELSEEVDLRWIDLTKNLSMLDKEDPIKVAICGKYTGLEDSYASIIEALTHCKAKTKKQIEIKMIDTSNLESDEDVKKELEGIDAVIVSGGFGNRGTEGKIKVIKYVRENDIPFLGICLGLQLAVIEFLRNICGIKEATSEEFNPTSEYQAIKYLPGQSAKMDIGGTLRLGSYDAKIRLGTKIHDVYSSDDVNERHRHRYEVSPKYHSILENNGMSLAGMSSDGMLVEFISLEKHSYFVGTQAHPELKSKLENPAPLFLGLIESVIKRKDI